MVIRVLPYALAAACILALTGCQSLAMALDDPYPYGSDPAAVAGPPGYNCAAQVQDAAIWGTLPSAFCSPYGSSFYWSRRAGARPYSFYGRPYGGGWRSSGWHRSGGFRGGYGGFRGGRGGRR
jgi:hypothetical protein